MIKIKIGSNLLLFFIDGLKRFLLVIASTTNKATTQVFHGMMCILPKMKRSITHNLSRKRGTIKKDESRDPRIKDSTVIWKGSGYHCLGIPNPVDSFPRSLYCIHSYYVPKKDTMMIEINYTSCEGLVLDILPCKLDKRTEHSNAFLGRTRTSESARNVGNTIQKSYILWYDW